VHLSCVDDGPQAQDAWLFGQRDAAVVRGEQLGERGYQATEQKRLGKFIGRADEDQDTISPIGERVVVVVIYPGHAQGLHHQPVDKLAELFLDGVGPPGGVLDVNREDAPVHWKRRFPAWPLAIQRWCVTVCPEEGRRVPAERPDLSGRSHVNRLGGRQGETKQEVTHLEPGATALAYARAVRRRTGW